MSGRTDYDGNIPLAISRPGKIKLVSTADTIKILSETCSLSVVGEKGSPKYTLSTIDISSTEELILTCTAINSSKKEMTATPVYETHSVSIYGETIPTEGGSVTPITFKAGEKKSISLTLPTAKKPQIYIIKVSLKSGDTLSNPIIFQYKIQGTSASIRSFSLDKDFYRSGDTANLLVLWSPSYSDSTRPIPVEASSIKSVAPSNEKPYTLPVLTLVASILDENQKECIIPVNKVLDNSSDSLELPISIIRDCKNPQAQVQIKDASGDLLVNKQLSFTTNTDSPEFIYSNTFFGKYGTIIFTILGILVVAGLSFYFINLKKKSHIKNDLAKQNETTI